MRESGWRVLCLQTIQAQLLRTPALYKITFRLVGAKKRVSNMNEEQKRRYEEEKILRK